MNKKRGVPDRDWEDPWVLGKATYVITERSAQRQHKFHVFAWEIRSNTLIKDFTLSMTVSYRRQQGDNK